MGDAMFLNDSRFKSKPGLPAGFTSRVLALTGMLYNNLFKPFTKKSRASFKNTVIYSASCKSSYCLILLYSVLRSIFKTTAALVLL